MFVFFVFTSNKSINMELNMIEKNVYTCPVCYKTFSSFENISIHLRDKRKNKQHANYINLWVKESFNKDDAFSFLRDKYLCFSRQSLNEKWKKWYDVKERRLRGNRVISKKNKGRVPTKEALEKVSEGVKKAYAEGRKKPPMLGKTPHNKGIPCPKEIREKISRTLRQKYANGDINLVNNGNNFHYGYRKDLTHFCRSSWEANIGRFFNYLGIEYEYEKYKFKLNSPYGELLYVPDFYLKKYNIFVEVKGRYEEISKIKHNLFKEQFSHYYLAIIDRKKYFKIERRLCRKVINWELSRKNIDLEKYLIKS